MNQNQTTRAIYAQSPIERPLIGLGIFLIFVFHTNTSFAHNKSISKSNLSLHTDICDQGFYQTINEEGLLVKYEYDGTDLSFETIAEFGFQVNATSFNILDGFMYCIAIENQRLIRFDLEGNYIDLGSIPLTESINIGGFDNKGNYYVGGHNDNQVFKINTSNLSVESLSISNFQKFKAADWAYIESKDRFYGVEGAYLFEFNPNNYEVNSHLLTGLETESSVFGAAFSTANDGLFVSNNISGTIYHIDIISFHASRIIDGPASKINDGSSCSHALPPFPAIIPANDTLCISHATSYDVLNNDLSSLEEIDKESFEIIAQAQYGSVTYYSETGTISYTSKEPRLDDFFIYKICLDHHSEICAQAIVILKAGSFTSFEENLCHGESLNFNGIEYEETGTYEFSFPSSNGCDSIVQLNLIINEDISFGIQAEICEGETFEVGGKKLGESGEYISHDTAENGCDSTIYISLTVHPTLDVNLGEDLYIDVGDGADLQATLEMQSADIENVVWSDNVVSQQEVALNQVVYPEETSSYSIFINDANGCTAYDEITIHVERNDQVYIPNAFTPDNDGVNDVFMIYGNEITPAKVISFQVYDRWGNQLFKRENFSANDTDSAWDGFYEGQRLNTGVFIYFAIVELNDGSKVSYKGDVTLVD